jgi:hypothetical protein
VNPELDWRGIERLAESVFILALKDSKDPSYRDEVRQWVLASDDFCFWALALVGDENIDRPALWRRFERHHGARAMKVRGRIRKQ